jgi:hypothetical protein
MDEVHARHEPDIAVDVCNCVAGDPHKVRDTADDQEIAAGAILVFFFKNHAYGHA